MTAPESRAEHDVVGICRELIRIDTTNTGEADTTVGEALAAEYVAGLLQGAGYEAERFATTAATRQGVAVRIPGADPARPALLLHGHLDVVPAAAGDWQVDPFGGEIGDGMLWGRGAVDMKDMDAMILSVICDWGRTGYRPPRDVVVLFTPDEEAGGIHGAHWIVDHRPDLLHGVSEAVGEVGGFSFTVRPDLRLYFLQVAEKGIAWLNLRAEGRAGHGSVVNEDNALTKLARAVAAIGEHRFPVQPTAAVHAMVAHLSEALGESFSAEDPEPILQRLGPLARMIEPGFGNTANPTMLSAGYKVNVIPGAASAMIDGRFVPGGEEQLLRGLRDLVGPDAAVDVAHRDVALEAPFEVPLVESMRSALVAEDPAARPVPYLMSGGTDGKAFSRLGVRCYGFAPLQLPADLDFGALFHGVDERVPIDSLRFGVRVLDRFLRSC